MNDQKKYIVLISIHGLIRSHDLELGRDSDTGGQTKYVVELAKALGEHHDVEKVDLLTRRVEDKSVSSDYATPIEKISENARIVRITCGPDEYIAKEMLWGYLDNFTDNAISYLKEQNHIPDIIHSHYADAGYVGRQLSHHLAIPLVYTGHSLGRSKRKRLLASGMKHADIEKIYNMSTRINAEEETLRTAELVVTSTSHEISQQYKLYDYYHPEKMKIIPPGTDLKKFFPPQGNERDSNFFMEISHFLKQPDKPVILALSRPDQRKNIHTLIEAYGENNKLQELANLVIIAGNREDITDLEHGPEEVLTKILLTIDKHNLYGKVAYPKKHKPEEVPLIYRLASHLKGVFVNPALTEPFGLTLIEAAACGIPIVATEDGGPVDIINNCANGHLIDPLDTDDIADKILKILEDSDEWKKYSDNGITGVAQYYSWKSHVNRYINTVEPVIERYTPAEISPFIAKRSRYRDCAIVTDIDQNLLGDKPSLNQFITTIEQHTKEVSFCIATGRRLDSALKILKKYRIPRPDILISSLGTEISYYPDLTKDIAWAKHIDYLWNRKAVIKLLADIPGLKAQKKIEQNDFKISYFYDPEIAPTVEKIQHLLLDNEQHVNVVFSFGQFLDIIPVRASKGYALRWVSQQLDIPLNRMLTAGGSGADEDMMRGNTLSVVVANRHKEELSTLTEIEPIYFSKKQFAAGILDGIEHYDFFSICQGEQSND